jgi:hypothetical protein
MAERNFIAFIISASAILITIFLFNVVKKSEKMAIKKILFFLKKRFM